MNTAGHNNPVFLGKYQQQRTQNYQPPFPGDQSKSKKNCKRQQHQFNMPSVTKIIKQPEPQRAYQENNQGSKRYIQKILICYVSDRKIKRHEINQSMKNKQSFSSEKNNKGQKQRCSKRK